MRALTQHRRNLRHHCRRFPCLSYLPLLCIEERGRLTRLRIRPCPELIAQEVHRDGFHCMRAAIGIQQVVGDHDVEIGTGHLDTLTREGHENRFKIMRRFYSAGVTQKISYWSRPASRLPLQEGRATVRQTQRTTLYVSPHARFTRQHTGEAHHFVRL